MTDLLSKMNPTFKFAAVIVFSTYFTFTQSLRLNVWVFGVCMCLLFIGARPKQWLRACIILIPVSVLAFSIYMTAWHLGNDAAGDFGRTTLAATQSGINMATRFYAFASLGIVFALTTDPYDLIKSLQKDAKLPRKFAYGMLCAVNLFPYIKNEYSNARLAFQVRGTRLTVFSLKPIFSMLVNSIRWSEVLSMAMYSKGFYEE